MVNISISGFRRLRSQPPRFVASDHQAPERERAPAAYQCDPCSSASRLSPALLGREVLQSRMRRSIASSQAEGEGFEPSIRLTTDNGFRDRTKSADMQGFAVQFASEFASARLQRRRGVALPRREGGSKQGLCDLATSNVSLGTSLVMKGSSVRVRASALRYCRTFVHADVGARARVRARTGRCKETAAAST
jgi:hypothetical protein